MCVRGPAPDPANSTQSPTGPGLGALCPSATTVTVRGNLSIHEEKASLPPGVLSQSIFFSCLPGHPLTPVLSVVLSSNFIT